jgi:hypothetical protein
MFIGRDTQVVGVEPRISQAEFRDTLIKHESPGAADAEAAWDIVRDNGVDPLFALAVYHQESQFATDPASATVQFGLRNPGHTRTSRIGFTDQVNTPNGPFMRYPAWADGWRDLAFRLVDPTFVYVQEGRRAIAPVITRWAPPPENDTENYIARVVSFMNEFASAGMAGVGDEDDEAELVFGRVPHPPHVRDIINKPDGFGMDILGPRMNLGVVYHRTEGRSIRGTGEHFKNPTTKALTQYGVGAPPPGAPGEDGLILLWSDPVGNVAPWASGPWENPPGDGRAFVAKFGVNAINQHLIAIEISGFAQNNTDRGLPEDPISDTTIDAVAALSAHWADRARIPHFTYPMNPHTGLLYTYWHSEFQNHKTCPGDVVRGATSEIIRRTKAIMKRHQTGGV